MTATYEELVSQLAHGISHRALYHDQHPRVTGAADEFVKTLRRLLKQDDKRAFFLGVVQERLVHDGHFLLGSTLQGRRLLRFAQDLCCGGFLFKPLVLREEVIELFALASETREPFERLATANAALRARGITNVELSPPYEDPAWLGQQHFEGSEVCGDGGPDDTDGDAYGGAGAIRLYQSLFEAVEVLHSRAEGDHELDLAAVRATAEELRRQTREGFHHVLRLAQYPHYDAYTIGHSVRVCLLATLAGTRLSLADEVLVELSAACLVHDVGKSKVPSELLYKRGRLDAEESALMATHALLGAHILLENHDVGSLALRVAYGHHVRCDGGGYPTTEIWSRRSPITDLVQVCDAFEAITAVRPHQPQRSARRAFELLLADRQAFGPGAIAALASATGLYPPGSSVLLSSGEQALVLAAGCELDRPTVELTHDPRGRPLSAADRLTLDLAAEASRSLHVRGTVLCGLASRPLDTTAP